MVRRYTQVVTLGLVSRTKTDHISGLNPSGNTIVLSFRS